MRHEFRYQERTVDGRLYLDVTAHAEIEIDPDVAVDDEHRSRVEIVNIYLNGGVVSGPLFEAVHDFMCASGVMDTIDKLPAGGG